MDEDLRDVFATVRADLEAMVGRRCHSEETGEAAARQIEDAFVKRLMRWARKLSGNDPDERCALWGSLEITVRPNLIEGFVNIQHHRVEVTILLAYRPYGVPGEAGYGVNVHPSVIAEVVTV